MAREVIGRAARQVIDIDHIKIDFLRAHLS